MLPNFWIELVRYYHFNIKNGIRDSAATAMLGPVMKERENLKILTESEVQRVILNTVPVSQERVSQYPWTEPVTRKSFATVLAQEDTDMMAEAVGVEYVDNDGQKQTAELFQAEGQGEGLQQGRAVPYPLDLSLK